VFINFAGIQINIICTVNFLDIPLKIKINKKQKNMALAINESNFNELVTKSDKLVVLDFWAEWCGPCRAISPVIEELANEYEGKAVIGKVDVDSNAAIAEKYGIRNIPTIIFIKNDEIKDKIVGAVPKSALVSKIEALL
jgi:thioredoxin 1